MADIVLQHVSIGTMLIHRRLTADAALLGGGGGAAERTSPASKPSKTRADETIVDDEMRGVSRTTVDYDRD